MATVHRTPPLTSVSYAPDRQAHASSLGLENTPLTLRERAAIEAMHALIASDFSVCDDQAAPRTVARVAVEYADELCEALRRKGGH